jgi:hypothetical protein
MTDPWDIAAQKITQQRAETARLQEMQRKEAQAEFATKRAAADVTHREMQAATAEAVRQLTTFFSQRGAAALRLLAAHGKDAFVVFGAEREGGEYFSIYLDKNGLRREEGAGGDYGTRPFLIKAATLQEAVEAFAYHGPGVKNPQVVRNIVSWLVEQINKYQC